MRAMLVIGALLVGSVLTPSAVTATTYFIRPDGSGDFPTIQAAIDIALPGDVILLTDGTFTGPGNRDIDFGGRDLFVGSASGDPLRCRIDCEGTPVSPHRGFFFRSGETTAARVQGLEIVNGWSLDYGGGIALEYYSSATIADCILSHCNAAYAGAGVSCREGCRPTLRGCRLVSNGSGGDIVAHGGGMYCGHNSYALVERCTFWDNRATLRGGGFHCHANSDAALNECTFYGNSSLTGANVDVRNLSTVLLDHSIVVAGRSGEGVSCESGCDAFLYCCDVYGNAGGDWVGCLEDQLGVYGNFTADPLFCGPDYGDFHLQDDSPCGPSVPPCGLIGAWSAGCGSSGLTRPDLAGGLALGPGQPNPFGSRIRIPYYVPEGAGAVRLEICDVAGRIVCRFLRGQPAPGDHEIVWNGCDALHRPLPAGAYFAMLRAGQETVRRRILLVR